MSDQIVSDSINENISVQMRIILYQFYRSNVNNIAIYINSSIVQKDLNFKYLIFSGQAKDSSNSSNYRCFFHVVKAYFEVAETNLN